MIAFGVTLVVSFCVLFRMLFGERQRREAVARVAEPVAAAAVVPGMDPRPGHEETPARAGVSVVLARGAGRQALGSARPKAAFTSADIR